MAAYTHGIAEALGFCTLLSRHPWLDIGWQGRITFPELVEGNIPKINESSAKKRKGVLGLLLSRLP